jgi:hypothetical protein
VTPDVLTASENFQFQVTGSGFGDVPPAVELSRRDP